MKNNKRVYQSNRKLVGVSDNDYNYFNSNKEKFGKVVKVVMRDYDKQGVVYPLTLWNENGDRMKLATNSGYGGTGPQTTVKILHEAGINIDPEFIFKNSEFVAEVDQDGRLFYGV
ncbi:hypothetical protein HSE3_gp034 [Bacillus phage vB_BceM-HSE3]|nr:hypothetical protein HSE3_gp034 [Bacillus phage vB_BceM-HSE3]